MIDFYINKKLYRCKSVDDFFSECSFNKEYDIFFGKTKANDKQYIVKIEDYKTISYYLSEGPFIKSAFENRINIIILQKIIYNKITKKYSKDLMETGYGYRYHIFIQDKVCTFISLQSHIRHYLHFLRLRSKINSK